MWFIQNNKVVGTCDEDDNSIRKKVEDDVVWFGFRPRDGYLHSLF